MKHKCKVVTGVHANYNSVRAVKISFVSTFCDSFFMYITSNDNYNMISLATWCNKHLKIYHQIAFENTPTVSLKSKHKVSNIPYPLQRLSTPYPYATWWVTKTLNLTTQISLLTEGKKTTIQLYQGDDP